MDITATKQILAQLTKFSESDLIQGLMGSFQTELGSAPSAGTLAILCAQVALETANGAKCMNWNLGNFKAPDMDMGSTKWCCFTTSEYGIDGKVYVIKPPAKGCAFQAFDNLMDGCTHYLRTMYDHWTQAWQACYKGDVVGFAEGLKARGYYTAPVDQYVKGVQAWYIRYKAIIDSMNQGQTGMTIPPAPEPSTISDLSLGWWIDNPLQIGTG